jgi:hypothetical protein
MALELIVDEEEMRLWAVEVVGEWVAQLDLRAKESRWHPGSGLGGWEDGGTQLLQLGLS